MLGLLSRRFFPSNPHRISLVLILVAWLIPTAAASAQTDPTISGRVTDSAGTPINAVVYSYKYIDDAGVEADWYGQNTQATDENGDYTLCCLSAGLYRLEIIPNSNAYRKVFYNNQSTLDKATDIIVPEEGDLVGYDIVLPLAGHVTGTVVDPEGNPVAGIQVQSYIPGDEGNYLHTTATTDSNGRYTLDIGVDGPFLIQFWPDAALYYFEYYDNARDHQHAKRLTVPPAQTITVNAALERTKKIQGIVRDKQGLPVADVHVAFYQRYEETNEWVGPIQATLTDVNGFYQFTNLQRDYYWLLFGGDYIVPEFYNNGNSFETAARLDLFTSPEIVTISPVVDRLGTRRNMLVPHLAR